MKFARKIVAIGMSLALIGGLTGCGGSSADIMKTAEQEMAKVKSLTYDMSMDMNMSIAGQKMETSTTGKIDYTAEPMAMKMDLVMKSNAQESTNISMYAEELDGKYFMYMSTDGTTWMKKTLVDASELEQYNAQESMQLYLKGIKDFKEVGTEKINGSDAVRFDGVISKDAISDVMAASGVADQWTQLGLTQEQIDAIYTDLADLPVSIWIDKASSLPVRYDMDMTQIMQKMMGKMLESMAETQSSDVEFKVDKMFISMTLSNFNKVKKIEIPEEARKGQEATF